MKPKYFFKDDKISYPEFLKTIEKMLEQGHFFCEKACIEKGVEALSKINESGKERLIKTSVMIDRVFSKYGNVNRNCAHKLPVILKSADLIVNFPEEVENLSDEELILISDFYSYNLTPYFDRKFSFFFNKEVLKSIREKTTNYNKQQDILTAIGFKFNDLNIDEMDDLQYNTAKGDMLNTIKNSTAEELINMVNIDERINKTMREVNF